MSVVKQALISLALLAIAGTGWYVYQHPQMVGLAREAVGDAERNSKTSSSTPASRIPGLIGNGAVNVITASVQADVSGERVVALGTAKAASSVTIFSQVAGVVAEILFRPGQAVEAGAALVRLEDAEQLVAVDRARIVEEQARAALERSRALAQSKTISGVALSDAQATAELAKVDVRVTQIALERRTLRAPFAGVTGLTDVSVGDFITSATPVVGLDDVSTMRVGFEVPERWAQRIKLGAPIGATAQGLADVELAGHVTGIDNRIDEATRTLRLEAEIGNPDQALKTGMAVTVTLKFDPEDQLAVPTLAVQWDRRGSYVWKVGEGAARRSAVTILHRESGLVIVAGDIEAGDAVVVEGLQRLREGARVSVVDASPALVGEDAADPQPIARRSTPETRAVGGSGAQDGPQNAPVVLPARS